MRALLARKTESLPGLVGVARVGRDSEAVVRRVRPGDIAVLDAPDLDRRCADRLIEAGAAAVLNAAPSISGRYPNSGPEALVAAGICVIDTGDPMLLAKIADGSRIRVDGPAVYPVRRNGKDAEPLVFGVELAASDIAYRMIEARAGMADRVAEFATGVIEFLRMESALLIDGVGVPKLRVALRGEKVVVVSDGPDHVEQLAQLRPFCKEYAPIMIGVGTGADTILRAGYRPDLIVADPDEVSAAALRCGAELIVPADTQGQARGVVRLHELGVGATTFPSAAPPTELAVLLAHHYGAALLVVAGGAAGMDEFFDDARRECNPAVFATRLAAQATVVDARAIASLYQSRTWGTVLALLVFALLVAVIVGVTASDATDPVLDWLLQGWYRAENWIRTT